MGTTSLISPASVGVLNRMRVLTALHTAGPQSRADLARTFGVSRATVGTILQPLLDNGVLVEGAAPATSESPAAGNGSPATAAGSPAVGAEPPAAVAEQLEPGGRTPGPGSGGPPRASNPARSGGKPPRPVWFSAVARSIGAVQILPGRIDVAAVSLTGQIRSRATAAFAARAGDPSAFAAALRSCCAEGLAGTAVIGVGVASAGLVDPDGARLVELNAAPALAGYPVGAALGDQLGAPVYLEHHARVQALGDRWFGAGRGLDTFASVSTGDSVGVGVVQHGTVLSAPGAGSGAHLTVAAGGARCDCGRRGCWKTVASLGWLRRRAAALGVPGARGTTLGRLTARAERGDRSAAGLIDEYAANLALGLGNVQQLLAPGTFILHGDAAAGGATFADRLADHLAVNSPHRPDAVPTVMRADPNRNTALLGCAGLVLSEGMQLVR
ncbi:hypothetical protein Athai_44530 [Actinocatenispora thailandica]|uniref:Uncharacterized protein n=1 Tax=Actinocatenispora thailandica TaxID=227318 RepID=A0A7R7DSQ1_9ACTN|nr:ROK family transcriptional regulator [Actinocatenispora thailandica]BCJ36950.1 hypothetical protein Athai_44530 [Actinocatenispora thailandica]